MKAIWSHNGVFSFHKVSFIGCKNTVMLLLQLRVEYVHVPGLPCKIYVLLQVMKWFEKSV